MANGCVDRPVGDRVRVAGVSKQPLLAMLATRAKKLVAQLGELNLKPSDIALVAVSHTHGDHVGNVDLFPAATLLIQKAEVDWAFPEGKAPPFKRDRLMKLLTGDFDVFGDDSATLLSTPGHTPGHQSLLVHLGNTGWVDQSRWSPGVNVGKPIELSDMCVLIKASRD